VVPALFTDFLNLTNCEILSCWERKEEQTLANSCCGRSTLVVVRIDAKRTLSHYQHIL